ncbi:MAG: creatininase family protein [Opitutaceae bacterium]|jgi:creatinine amidohydrolase
MPPFWLANAAASTAWAHRAWSELAARTDKETTVVVLPVHGFADHGMGLPLDAEEIVGSAVLRSAVEAVSPSAPVLVLTPLRFGLAPYPHTFFGVDAPTSLAIIQEIAAGVKSAGFAKLLFFNTSPWNAETVATAALELRVRQDLSAYVINAGGIGLGFHPADTTRRQTQAMAASLLVTRPDEKIIAANVKDADFRPGFYGQPAPVKFDAALDGPALLTAAANQLAALLAEIVAHRSPGRPPVIAAPASFADSSLWPADRTRTLGALTRRALEEIPNKSRALVIIPAGAIEQHGHHLPLGTDAMLGQLWLAHALPKLPAAAPVYVAPPITYGKSIEHSDFAGTITVTAQTLRSQLLALVAQLQTLGFRQIAVLNTHGGNSAVLTATIRELQMSPDLRIGMLRGYYKPDQNTQESAFGFHAGEWETSLMLAGAPELVQMDRAVCEYPAHLEDPGYLRPEGALAVFAWKTSDVSKSGVMGDATLATQEKGLRWLDEASTALAQKIQSLLA